MKVFNFGFIVAIFAGMKVDISSLLTVKNYALKESVTPSYIYKLVKEGKMNVFPIDGVQFVDTNIYPVLPVVNRR